MVKMYRGTAFSYVEVRVAEDQSLSDVASENSIVYEGGGGYYLVQTRQSCIQKRSASSLQVGSKKEKVGKAKRIVLVSVRV